MDLDWYDTDADWLFENPFWCRHSAKWISNIPVQRSWDTVFEYTTCEQMANFFKRVVTVKQMGNNRCLTNCKSATENLSILLYIACYHTTKDYKIGHIVKCRLSTVDCR